MICTFFGHRDCPDFVTKQLKDEIIYLIKNKDVNQFYVGNRGGFDRITTSVLAEIKKEYPEINYDIVLAYMPVKRLDASNTVLPDGIEGIPKRFAITYRNNWMANQADFVISYVVSSFGGAAQALSYARKKNKTIINLADK